MKFRGWFTGVVLVTVIAVEPARPALLAQAIPAARLAVLQAEAHGATDARDMAALRSAVRSTDEQTVRLALRVLGRLGKPAVVADISPALRAATPEVRAEAAQAIASAFSTVSTSANPATAAAKTALASLNSALSLLVARLQVEAEPAVRAAICEALARLPLNDEAQMTRVETALLGVVHSDMVADRLGVVKGIEILVRRHAPAWAVSGESVAILRELMGLQVDTGENDPANTAGPARDARIRRLALEALTLSGHLDPAVLQHGALDGDWQVRRLAMQAAGVASGSITEVAFETLKQGMADAHPLVRIASLNGESVRARGTAVTCGHLVSALDDPSPHVVLAAIDLLASCRAVPESLRALERVAGGANPTSAQRGNPQEHARIALAGPAPQTARADLLGPHADWPTPDAVITAADLARLSSARARVTIRDLGSFDMTLLTAEAPATVVRFVRLVERGDFSGRPIGGWLPAAVGLARLAPGAMTNLRNETGTWPHVRGAVGLSLGNGTDGASVFVDLVDMPRHDQVYPVFAHVLNGMDVIDQILEGDIIEKIEIL